MFGSKGRARLEIELPTGISIVYDADHAGKLPTRAELMARMRAAIGATDWEAVKALYGERPYTLDGSSQIGGSAASPSRRVSPPSKPAGQSSGDPPAARSVVSSP